MKHFLSVDDLKASHLKSIFSTYEYLKNRSENPRVPLELKGKIVVSLFFEPSTRTATSFEAATYRLEGQHISIKDISKTSVSKGESFEDTIRSFSSFGDIIVLRHPKNGAAKRAAKVSSVPVINAGDGSNEHPTQALLDLFTIQDRLKRRISFGTGSYPESLGTTDLTVTFVGDLKNGRTVHSLAKLLARFEGIRINYAALKKYQIEDAFMESLDIPQKKYVPEFGQGPSIDLVNDSEEEISAKFKKVFEKGWVPALTPELLSQTDVLYMTRVQQERISSSKYPKKIIGCRPDLGPSFPKPQPDILTTELVSYLPQKSIIMHPFPRVDEIDFEVDEDPRVAYFDQMRNGVFTRAALLNYIILK